MQKIISTITSDKVVVGRVVGGRPAAEGRAAEGRPAAVGRAAEDRPAAVGRVVEGRPAAGEGTSAAVLGCT